MNPDQLIATLSPDSKINMEMNVTTGFGYATAEKIRTIIFRSVPYL